MGIIIKAETYKHLRLQHRSKSHIDIHFENGVRIGEYICDVDGFFYFWQDIALGTGAWSAYVLRELADKLDELNKPWQDHIDKELKGPNERAD